MKNTPALILILLSGVALVSNNALAAPENSELLRLDALEKAVAELRQEVNLLRQEATSKNQTQAEMVNNAKNTLILQSWDFREMQVKYNRFHALDLNLYNGYDKAIGEIDARLEFKNLLGEHVYSLRVALSEAIPPQTAYTDRGTAANKRLFGKGSILEKISASSVTAHLMIRRLVFADGSVVEF